MVDATSMSSKWPKTWGRMASRSNGPTRGAVTSLLAATVKWLNQKRAQRSRKAASVVQARRMRARNSSPAVSRIIFWAIFTGSALGSPAALASRRVTWYSRNSAKAAAPVLNSPTGWSAPPARICDFR